MGLHHRQPGEAGRPQPSAAPAPGARLLDRRDQLRGSRGLAAKLLPAFAAATGLRPEEWQALERRDIDREAGIASVSRTVSSGEVVDLGKTARSRRQVPLSGRAREALEEIPPRLDTPLLFRRRVGA